MKPTPITVVRVQCVLATRHLGLTVGDARFSDGLLARFRVLSRDPIAVRMVTDRPLPAHEKAVEEWLARNARAAA